MKESESESTIEEEPSPSGNEDLQGGNGKTGGGQLRKILRRQFAMQMENVIPEDIQRVLDQLEDRLQDLRDSEDVEFAETTYDRVKLAGKMFQSWAEGSHPLPWRSLTAIAAGSFYLANPLNVLPKMLKGDDDEALLDDPLVIYLCYTLIEQDLRTFLEQHGLNPEEFGFESKRSTF